MKIAIASDHAGFKLKEFLKDTLKGLVSFEDFGTFSEESVDYTDFGSKVAEAVSIGVYERGILICKTGIGMSVVANKFKNIIATLCFDENTAIASRAHNNSNVLCLPGIIDYSLALRIVKLWLETPFEGGRHERRYFKIRAIENRNFK
ncbi:MAG: ribose 5-phosphate isomerase B [Candidatus Aminicenantia bacterium]